MSRRNAPNKERPPRNISTSEEITIDIQRNSTNPVRKSQRSIPIAFNNIFVHKGNKDKLNKSALNTYARVINNFDVRKRFISTQSADGGIQNKDEIVTDDSSKRDHDLSMKQPKSSAENSINRGSGN